LVIRHEGLDLSVRTVKPAMATDFRTSQLRSKGHMNGVICICPAMPASVRRPARPAMRFCSATVLPLGMHTVNERLAVRVAGYGFVPDWHKCCARVGVYAGCLPAHNAFNDREPWFAVKEGGDDSRFADWLRG